MTHYRMLAGATALVAVSALFGAAAMAQETGNTVLLKKIIIGYTADGAPIFAGDNTTYLDAEDLEQQGGTGKLDDVLRDQPSTFTRVNEGNPGVAVNIRGFEGSGRVAMSVDGVPQNFRFTGHEAQGFAYVDPNLLAGVDITRGSQTTAGGTGIAGSVNFRTISADDIVDDLGFGGLTRVRYGENAEDKSGMAAIAYKNNDFDVMLAISGRNANNYFDGDYIEVLDTDKDITTGLGKAAFRIDDRQEVTFSAMRYDTEYFANSYEQRLINDTLTAGYSFDGVSPWINLDVNLFYGKNEMEYLAGSGSAVGRVMSTDTIGGNATNISEFDWNGWLITGVNGVDYSRDVLGGVNGNVNPVDGETTRMSFFTENTFKFDKFEFIAGLRANSYKTEGLSADLTTIDVDYQSFDPKVTAGYWVTDWLQPYVTYSRASRIPTLQETLLGGSHGDVTGPWFNANPNLRPEVSTGYEVGLNIDAHDVFAPGDSFGGRINYYRMDVEDYIVATVGAFTGFTNVAGVSKTQGLEVELKYSTTMLDLALAYSHSDNDLPDQINGLGAIQNIPRDKVTLTVAGHFLEDTLTVGTQYSYVSPDPVEIDSYGTEEYQLVDLFASYDVTEKLNVNAKVTNLFNEVYRPSLSTTGSNGQGRSFFIGAEARF